MFAKNAPAFLGKVNKNNVPSAAILTVFRGILIGIILNYIIPEKAFVIFSSPTTFGLISSWSGIVISHYT
ncbi:hypothetical protein [Clostridium muellerianum]|uniref:hypothetical protein n=1 Tax=Clostridium muellerianum TaxID=2716538 RepID=UPI003CC97652